MRHHWSCRSPRRELAVQHRHRAPEAGARGAHEHRRQADLGHQHDRAAAPRERRLDGPEVDLRLPAARHAVEEERPEGAARESLEQGPQRGFLVRGRHDRRDVARRQPLGRPHLALVDEAHGSLLGQASDRAAQRRPVPDELRDPRAPSGRAQPLDDLDLGSAAQRRERLGEHGHLPLAEAGGVDRLLHLHEPCAAQAGHGGLRIAPEPLLEGRQPQGAALQLPQHGIDRAVTRLGRLHQAHDGATRPYAGGREDGAVALTRRCEVVLRHPGGEIQERRGHERALVEDLDHVLQGLARALPRGTGHDADHPATAERDENAHAALRHRGAARHPVREGRLEGHRQHDGNEPLVHGAHSTRWGWDRRSDCRVVRAAISPGRGPAVPGGGARPSCPPTRPSCPRDSAAGRPGGRSA